ncbi:hypothetical protein KFZ58_17535 [Virgibacillus sp. NKC19-16]|uniref:hypothetical protein n=1 Tax=Virgibacillus salidurans TaxID=2831673 RepID=UPI001F241093|nr:hypothetical protein [Virgibacillus sp. NKC19-16]UJL46138.1 hypothetical protein KFZ58_17535 [Virgibacillus sp. NKC19-16]
MGPGEITCFAGQRAATLNVLNEGQGNVNAELGAVKAEPSAAKAEASTTRAEQSTAKAEPGYMNFSQY